MIGAIREMYFSIIDDLKYNDKRTVNTFHKNVERIFKEFDRTGLNDNVIYDNMVAAFIDVSGGMIKQMNEAYEKSLENDRSTESKDESVRAVGSEQA